MPCVMWAKGHCRHDRSAGNSPDLHKAKSCWKVCIEEVPEGQPEPQETKLPPGFASPNSEDMDQGDRLFTHFMSEHQEEIQTTQTISQKLAEVAGEAHLTHF